MNAMIVPAGACGFKDRMFPPSAFPMRNHQRSDPASHPRPIPLNALRELSAHEPRSSQHHWIEGSLAIVFRAAPAVFLVSDELELSSVRQGNVGAKRGRSNVGSPFGQKPVMTRLSAMTLNFDSVPSFFRPFSFFFAVVLFFFAAGTTVPAQTRSRPSASGGMPERHAVLEPVQLLLDGFAKHYGVLIRSQIVITG
jgi:hypothetical protein